jgi:ribonuclease-3
MSKIEKFLLSKYKEQSLDRLERLLGYEFKNKLLFVKSMSHPSLKQKHDFKLYFSTQKHEFEKLEFLGDAVLNLITTKLLIDLYPRLTEGVLAKFKNYLVSKKVLSQISLDISLPDFLLMTDGEKKTGGQTNDRNLENALEALMAAIFLDSDLLIVTQIVKKLWHKYIEAMGDLVLDPKSSLQELAHLMSLGVPKYEVIDKIGADNNPMFTVRVSLKDNLFVEAEGKSKKEAEINSAKKLLTMLSN